MTQGDPKATGGSADAKGGDGGSADTGNEQKYNGNAYAESKSKSRDQGPPKSGGSPCGCGPPGKGGHPDNGGHNDADATGGDTTATSGDATGGSGGNATADGGDAKAGNHSKVEQTNESSGSSSPSHPPKGDCGCGGPKAPPVHPPKGDCGCHPPKGDCGCGGPKVPPVHPPKGECGCVPPKDDSSSSQSNESTVEQGSPTATGGNAEAVGGSGGSADTGNTQKYNGNAIAKVVPQQQNGSVPFTEGPQPCGCEHPPWGGGQSSDADAVGGDTTADSGDADGGDGGDAGATGGSAEASNWSKVLQSNLKGLVV